MIGRSRETRILWKIPWSEHFKDKIRCRRVKKKTLFSQENEEEEDASGKTIKDIEEEKKAEKEKQQK